MKDNEKCKYCGNGDVVRGTLEGISFMPSKNERRFFAKGVYGITASACPDCGRLSSLALDAPTLKAMVTKKTR